MASRRHHPLLLGLATLLAAAGCNCGEDGLQKLHDGQIVISSPADGSTADSSVHFAAEARATRGLKWLSLRVGTEEIQTCPPGADSSDIACDKDFLVPDYMAQAENGALTLTALAKDESDNILQTSVKIVAAPLTVAFVKPTAGPTGAANLRGTSALTLEVKSLTPVEAVQVTADDNDKPIAQWRATPYTQNVAWAQLVGTGPHTLKAAARDTNGAVARAELAVVISCATDKECATGTRCCPTSGRCNPIVGRGEDCDCDHPCPTDEGCFPGTCGELPRKCRPGCFPGGQQRGQVADRCSAEPQGNATVPAYCAQLPGSEATAQNKGGACAPADNCSVMTQNCPDATLNPNAPASQSNPIVHYSCEPASPTGNACLPAGNIPLHGTGCEYDTCGDTSKACQKGLICVTPIDQNGNPVGAATCEKQCSDPSPNPFGGSRDCASREFCNTLYGPGLEQFPTGTCQHI